MPTIELIGRILPQGRTISLPPFPRLEVSAPEKASFGLTIRIQDSQVSVTCDGDEVHDLGFMEYYIPAIDLVRTLASLGALHQGLGLTVVFEKIRGTDGLLHEFSFGDPALIGVFTAYDISANMAPVTQLALDDPRLRVALHDLVEAITHPNDTAINSGRVVEAIRNMVAKANATTAASWEQLRSALNIDRTFLDLITASSIPPRHGDYVHVPGPLNQELSIRACKVMNRYLEFRLRGSTSLREPDFPLLTE